MEWLLQYVVPYVVPLVTPILVEYLKIAVAYIDKKLPHSVIVALAGVVAEGLNAVQSYVTGNPLPYGLGGILAVLARELRQDFARVASR